MSTKYWYVYKIIFSDNTFYIGYRGCKVLPELDFLKVYFSSSKVVKNKIENNVSYFGEILMVSKDKSFAYEFEQRSIHENMEDIKILNRCCYHVVRNGFGILTDSAISKISLSSKERWEDPEYRKKLKDIHKNRYKQDVNLRDRASEYAKKRWADPLNRLSQAEKIRGHKVFSNIVTGEVVSFSLDEVANLDLDVWTMGNINSKGIRKSEEHNRKNSEALKLIKKSEDHKINLGISKLKHTVPENLFIITPSNVEYHWIEFYKLYKIDPKSIIKNRKIDISKLNRMNVDITSSTCRPIDLGFSCYLKI